MNETEEDIVLRSLMLRSYRVGRLERQLGCLIADPDNVRQVRLNRFLSEFQPYAHQLGVQWRAPVFQGGVPLDAMYAPDPGAGSSHRAPGGLAVWDFALFLRDNRAGVGRVLPFDEVPCTAGGNFSYEQATAPALGRIGPLGEQGQLVRPKAPWIFDLMAQADGWQLLEAAHVLTHFDGDHRVVRDPPMKHVRFSLAKYFHRSLSELAVSLVLGLPLDVRDRRLSDAGDSRLPFGLNTAPSTNILDPVLGVPFEGPGSLVIDRTTGTVCCGLHIAPPPHEFWKAEHPAHELDRWSCLPTLVTLVGWETPDILTHSSLATYRSSRSRPLFFARHAHDLMPVEYLVQYINLSRGLRGLPEDLPGFQHVRDWMKTPEYRQALKRTPPFPCAHCMALNSGSPATPRRPRNLPTEFNRPQADADWRKYLAAVDQITERINRGILVHDPGAGRWQRDCNGGNTKRIKELKDRLFVEQAEDRGVASYTQRQQDRYYRLKAQFKGAQT